jgi:hypothetical protein
MIRAANGHTHRFPLCSRASSAARTLQGDSMEASSRSPTAWWPAALMLQWHLAASRVSECGETCLP